MNTITNEQLERLKKDLQKCQPNDKLANDIWAVIASLESTQAQLAEVKGELERLEAITLGNDAGAILDQWVRSGAGKMDPSLGVLQGLIQQYVDHLTTERDALRVENDSLRRDKTSADALLLRANNMLSRANIMLYGWEQAIEWNKDYLVHTNCDDTKVVSTPKTEERTHKERLEYPKFLLEMAERLRTQDNLGTSHPLYCVMQKERIYGIGPDYSEQYDWNDVTSGDYCDATPEEAKQLEQMDEDGEDTILNGIEFEKHYYIERDRFIAASLTLDGAEEHLRLNGHNLPGAHIFVTSLYRTPDMIALREWLLSLPSSTTHSEEGGE